MKTKIHLWSYLAHFFLNWEMFQAKVVEKLKTHILYSIVFFSKVVPFMRQCVKMLLNGAGHKWQYGACALFAGYRRLQTSTRSEMLTGFPLQHWLHGRAWVLLYTYMSCLASFWFGLSASCCDKSTVCVDTGISEMLFCLIRFWCLLWTIIATLQLT